MSDEQTTLFRDNAEYDAFARKFKPKESHRMNSDDCYTPSLVFRAIQDWACAEYGIDPASIVRPFYPGGDYENEDYSEGCVVLDNPPFSILKEIAGFYRRRGIHFFLFGPALLLCRDWTDGLTVITPGVSIEYANGAVVNTGFVTDLGGEVVARTAPELGMKIRVALANTYGREPAAGTRKNAYPPEFLSCAMLETYSRGGGAHFSVLRGQAQRVSALDAQKAEGRGSFGGWLLGKTAAEAKAQAAKCGVSEWQLSEREKEIVRRLK